MIETMALILLTGMVTGLLSGLLGVGGGLIIVPMLTFGFGVSQHMAQGISLLVIIPTALAGMWQLHKEKLINYSLAAYLALGAIIGSSLAAQYVQSIDAATLKRIFAFFMIILAVRMFWTSRK